MLRGSFFRRPTGRVWATILLTALMLAGCNWQPSVSKPLASTQLSEMSDTLLRQVADCWELPPGVETSGGIVVRLRIKVRTGPHG